MNANVRRLQALRRSIDALDRRLLAVINRRIGLVEAVARVKRAERLSTYAPEREELLLRALAARNRGPVTEAGLRAIFREILSTSRSHEDPLKVAYLGPEGTFSHQAVRQRFGSSTACVPVASIPDVFYEVDRRKAEYGMVPVENSSEGAVWYTLDTFMDSEVKICGEELLQVHHALMSNARRKEDIREVLSVPQVFGQCRRWLEVNLPRAHQTVKLSTAQAGQAAAPDPRKAALGPELVAKLYGLKVHARHVEDVAGNTTRFFVLAKSWSPRTGRDKTSLMVSLQDRVGALFHMLQPFRRNRLNLTSIESRPSRKRPWEYYFFIDCQGHLEDPPVARAVAQLEKICSTVKLLGSYPAAAGAAGR